MSSRRKHAEQEDPQNHERWLVTYADMVTLLMVLFIVMFAMSAVDQRKYEALASGLAAGFGDDSVMQGSPGVLTEDSQASAISPQFDTASLSKREQMAVDRAVQLRLQKRQRRIAAEADAEVARLDRVFAGMRAALERRGLGDDVQASYDDRGLVLSLISSQVVFEANMATLNPRGERMIDTLAPALRAIPNRLEIDGHTNQAIGRPKYFATDWDLSATRAITVLRRLNEHLGIPAERLSLAAYGSQRPLLQAREPGSQEKNKRVDIVVLSSAPVGTRARLEDAAKTRFGEEALLGGDGGESPAAESRTRSQNNTGAGSWRSARPATRRPRAADRTSELSQQLLEGKGRQ